MECFFNILALRRFIVWFFSFIILSGTIFAHGLPLAPRLLKAAANPPPISLKEAFERALKQRIEMQVAKNQLEQKRMTALKSMTVLFPKVRLGAVYTRNYPEINAEFMPIDPTRASLNRHVAELLRDAKRNQAASDLDHQTNRLNNRSNENKLVISPKQVLDGRLMVEVPLFNGPDIAKILAAKEAARLQATKVEEEEATTLYSTALAYYSACHLKNVLTVRKQALASSEERFVRAKAEKKRGLIIKRDYLLAEADFLQNKAALEGSLLEYRASIGNLGIMLGMDEDFAVEDPDNFMFQVLHTDAEKLIELAMTHRADLKALKQAQKVMDHERLQQFLQFLPTLSVQGEVKYTSNDKGMLGRHFTYAFSANASMSLFEGGVSIFEFKSISLKKQENELRIAQITTEINARIRGRKAKFMQLNMTKNATEVAFKATSEAFRVASLQFEKGMIDQQQLLEVSDRKINADIALKKAESDLNEEQLALVHEAGLLSPQFIK